MPQIQITINSEKQLFQLSTDPIVVGRHPECQYVVTGMNAEKASSRHLQILADGDQVFLEDLGSSNGTLINDEKCQSRTAIQPGDKIRLGSTGPELDIQLIQDSVPPVPDHQENASPAQANSKTDSPKSLPTPKSFIGGESGSLSDEGNKPPVPTELATDPSQIQLPIGTPDPDRPEIPAVPPQSTADVSARQTSVSPNQKNGEGKTKEPSTRQILMKLQGRNRVTWIVAVSVSLVVVIGFAIGLSFYWDQFQTATESKISEIESSQEKNKEDINDVKNKQDTNYQKISNLEGADKRIYLQTVQATAFIKNYNPGSLKYWRGSGFLVDREKGIIVTNHHVIDDGKLIDVWFPLKNPDGSYKLELSHYLTSVKPLRAKLIKSDPTKDLAIIQVQLDAKYDSITPLEIDTKPAGPGDKSYTTGSPGSVEINGWAFSSGNVKTLIPNWTGKYSNGQNVSADVIVTDNSIEKGDSGGPVVNQQGKLIGVVSSLAPQKVALEKNKLKIVGPRLQNYFIAANEVAAFLKKHVK